MAGLRLGKTFTDAQVKSVTDQLANQVTDLQNAVLTFSDITGQIDISQIPDASLTTLKLVDGVITTVKLADASVTSAKLGDGQITLSKFGTGLRPVEILSALPTSGNIAGRIVYLTTDQKLYRYNGTAFISTVAAADITGQLTSSQIVSLPTTQLTGTITSTQLGTGTVQSANVLDSAIIQAKIADAAISANKIMDQAVSSLKLADAAVTTAKLQVAAVTQDIILNGAVITAKLADAAVTGTKLASAAVDATKFASGIEPVGVITGTTVPTTKTTTTIYVNNQLYRWDTGLAAYSAAVPATNVTGTLTDAQIAAVAAAKVTGQITTTQITDGSISTAKIAAGAVVAASIATDTITANQIAANAITSTELAANSVVAGKIATNAVTAGTVAANAITTGTIAAGAITTSQLAAGAVTSSIIAAGAVTAATLAIGAGSNQLVNSDTTAGNTGWGIAQSAGTWNLTRRLDGYAPISGAFEVSSGSVTSGQYCDFFTTVPGSAATRQKYAVTPLAWYEFSGRFYTQQCAAVTFYIQWLDASGASLGYSGSGYSTVGIGGNVNYNFGSYQQGFLHAQAPSTAVSCIPFIRNEGNAASTAGPSYTWYTQVYFGASTANQSVASAWSPGGVSLISGGNIVTGSITSSNIAANTITGANISAGTITASNIAGGTITASQIQGGTITGSQIAAYTIGATNIATNAITSSKIVVSAYDNLVPDNQMLDTLSWGGSNWNPWLDPYLGGMASKGQFYYNYVAGSTGYSEQLTGQLFPVIAGQQYVATGGSYSNGNQAPLLRIHFFDRNNTTEIGSAEIGNWSGGTGAGYVQNTITVTAPAGCALARIQCYIQRSNTNSAVYVGGFIVRTKNAGSLIVDGSLTANLIAANTITANKLSIGSLDAISATLGSVNISSANIGTLTVGQSNIANNAATYYANGATGSNFSMASGAENTITNCVCVVGNAATVQITGAVYALSASSQALVKIYRGGTVIRQFSTPSIGSAAFAIADSPGNGSTTYSLNVQASGGTVSIASGGNINAVAYMK